MSALGVAGRALGDRDRGPAHTVVGSPPTALQVLAVVGAVPATWREVGRGQRVREAPRL